MKLFLSAIFIIIALISTQGHCANLETISYPGNGLPIFSKDKPVNKLNAAFNNYFSDLPSFRVSKGNIFFNSTKDHIELNTNIAVTKQPMTIKFSFAVENGKLVIHFGNINFTIEPEKSTIYEKEKFVRGLDSRITSIEISRGYNIDNQVVTTAYLCTDGGCTGGDVQAEFPATISVSVQQGSTGFLGQWFWGRGSK